MKRLKGAQWSIQAYPGRRFGVARRSAVGGRGRSVPDLAHHGARALYEVAEGNPVDWLAQLFETILKVTQRAWLRTCSCCMHSPLRPHAVAVLRMLRQPVCARLRGDCMQRLCCRALSPDTRRAAATSFSTTSAPTLAARSSCPIACAPHPPPTPAPSPAPQVFDEGLEKANVPYPYGFAIIALTVGVKLATFPLSQKQVGPPTAWPGLAAVVVVLPPAPAQAFPHGTAAQQGTHMVVQAAEIGHLRLVLPQSLYATCHTPQWCRQADVCCRRSIVVIPWHPPVRGRNGLAHTLPTMCFAPLTGSADVAVVCLGRGPAAPHGAHHPKSCMLRD